MDRLEELEKKIQELEKKINQSSNMFGRSYSSYGNTTSDFLIKTRGQVKIQWGSKFIDLIKDGKINVDVKHIFQGKIGVKDGFYVTDDNTVYLKVGNKEIPIIGEIGTTYVSFLGEQETGADDKYQALRNIGFLYPNLSDLNSSSLQNGIIYVESEQKLYIIKDGTPIEYTFKFPNPFTEQFIVTKNDSTKGAIIIKGSGINNSLAFDSLYMFTQEGQTYIQSGGVINISVNDTTYLQITEKKTTINNVVEANTFQSNEADENTGFMLFNDENGSTLIIDNLIVRNSTDSISTTAYPTKWSLKNNVITKVEEVADESLGSGYALHLKYENQYKVGDIIYTYGEVQTNKYCSKLIRIPLEIKLLNTETGNTIYASVVPGSIEETEKFTMVGSTTFLISSDEVLKMIRTSEYNSDLIEGVAIEEEQSIKARYGILDELYLKWRDNNQELNIVGLGGYFSQAYFDKAAYTTNLELPLTDDSTKFASTEWVKKLLTTLLPVGTIVAFNGTEIPEGWHICNGEEGTPDLTDKFIIGENTNPDEAYYTLIFIIKIS